LIKDNYPAVLQKQDRMMAMEDSRYLSLDEVWRVVIALGGLEPPRSPRPVVGPILTWARQCLWGLLGFEPTHRQLATIVCETLDSHLRFREGSHDRAIWLGVVNSNEYRLPKSFDADDIVIDIGMHIGSFCYAALLRGCRNVYGFEAEAENFSLAGHNLKRFGERVHLYHRAVWRSDRMGDTLFHGGYDADNTGGGSILYNTTGEKLDVIAFDEIIRDVTNDGQKRVRLVKIDCEGSEHPILLTSRLLHLIDSIHGEYHNCSISPVARVEGVSRFTIAELQQHLQKVGFAVKSFANHPDFGLFFATRTESPLIAGGQKEADWALSQNGGS
jgi:FkbM family methyltransferase